VSSKHEKCPDASCLLLQCGNEKREERKSGEEECLCSLDLNTVTQHRLLN